MGASKKKKLINTDKVTKGYAGKDLILPILIWAGKYKNNDPTSEEEIWIPIKIK